MVLIVTVSFENETKLQIVTDRYYGFPRFPLRIEISDFINSATE